MSFQYSVKCVPYRDEPEAGDGFYINELESGLLVLIIDVLGHGPKAAQLARQIEVWMEEYISTDIEWTLRQLDKRMLGSLGAAMTLVYFDKNKGHAYGFGVGNTLMRHIGDNGGSYSAQAGIVGELLPNLRPFEFEFNNDDTFIFTTDGVKENLSSEEISYAQGKAVGHLSSYFVESFSKPFDDATAIVVRYCND